MRKRPAQLLVVNGLNVGAIPKEVVAIRRYIFND